MPRFPASLAGGHRPRIPLAPPAPLPTDSSSSHFPPRLLCTHCPACLRASLRICGSLVSMQQESRRSSSADVWQRCSLQGCCLSHSAAPGAGGLIQFCLWRSSLVALSSLSACLQRINLNWEGSVMDSVSDITSSLLSSLGLCLFLTHTLALLAVWGHCDGDNVYGSLSQIKRITVEASECWPWRLTGSVHRRRNMRIKQVELYGVKSAHMAEFVIPNLVDDRNLFGSCRRFQSSSWSVQSDFLFIRRSPHTHLPRGKSKCSAFFLQWEVCKTNRIAAKSAAAWKHFEEHQNEVSETRHIGLMSGTSLMTSSTPHPPRKLIALIKRRANPKTLRRDVRN